MSAAKSRIVNIIEMIHQNDAEITRSSQPDNIEDTTQTNNQHSSPSILHNLVGKKVISANNENLGLLDSEYEQTFTCGTNMQAEGAGTVPDISVPGPSRQPNLSASSPIGEDFSSGSSDVWQPPHNITVQEQDSSDSETNLDDGPLTDNIEGIAEGGDVEQITNIISKRKKGHGPMQRKLRKIRSEARRRGEEFRPAKGKTILAKRPSGISVNCREKCHIKTENLNLLNVFEAYRTLPSRDAQRRYLAGLITIKAKERTRHRANLKNREITVTYTIDGADGNICKNCFTKVFAESRGFVNGIVKKKKSTPTFIIPNTDMRTARLQPGHKRSEADVGFARDFINSLPAYESHYSRSHTSKRYLEHNLSLRILYNLYLEKFESTRADPSAKPLSLSVFRNVFKSLNLKFKKPSNDTCKTCDSLSLKIKSCVSDEEKQGLETERTAHHNKATYHYETKRFDKERSSTGGGKVVVAAFDLQKCLATPNLTASVCFYKRKLWTFNLTIRNITTKRTCCYVWHEGIAQRGADEIASCLWHFIKNLSDDVEELIFYSDTCPGQNRNNILPIMFKLVLEQKTSLKVIDHKFLIPGHTHLECDTDHAAIERFIKKRNSTISVPQDWVSVIKMTSNRYDVKLMSQSDFFGFSKLLTTHFIKRNLANDKNSFAWNSIFWLNYKRSQDVGFKYTLSPEEPFRFYSIHRRGRLVPFADIEIPLAYNEAIIIDVLKYNDIQDLLEFIDPIYHEFYKTLKHSQSRYTRQNMSDSEENYDE